MHNHFRCQQVLICGKDDEVNMVTYISIRFLPLEAFEA